jgi:hypothetical protein
MSFSGAYAHRIHYTYTSEVSIDWLLCSTYVAVSEIQNPEKRTNLSAPKDT